MTEILSRGCVVIMLFSMGCAATSQQRSADLKQGVFRENIEWCDIWITSADNQDKPSVLLVGDSIVKGYYSTVATALGQDASCARFATSACVSDPAFFRQLEAVLDHNQFTLIHFNNGLHGIDYTTEAYEVGYEKALKYIHRNSPSTNIVVALTTPLQSTSDRASLNPLVDARNDIARALAEKYHLEINDLHAISKDHPEYYRDPYHYTPAAIRLQGEQVAEKVRTVLARH
ncbi:MAG: SGNH/GDSL hydrolase family protein [Phycisphaerae bacterium]|nr:SGNH/GDSL hydrolase family protein [Phycisphaerae bacterium]